MGGKPSPGTKKDKRLSGNKKTAKKKLPKGFVPFKKKGK